MTFHVVAHTNVSDYLLSFKRYDNVVVYPNIHQQDVIDDFIHKMDIYLDINHWYKESDIINRVQTTGKPILSFDNVTHRPEGDYPIVSHQNPQEMVEKIQDMVYEKKRLAYRSTRKIREQRFYNYFR